MSNIVNIQFGERHFTASQEILEQSPFLKKLLSGNESSQRVWFIDQDGDIFALVLRYLRSGVYPILYTKSAGYDYQTYALLFRMAQFLKLTNLAQWIEAQEYHEAIDVLWEHHIENDTSVFAAKANPNKSAPSYGTAEMRYRTMLTHEDFYVCPRNIQCHMGDRDRCGRQCENEQPEEGPLYLHKPVQRTAITKVSTKLNLSKCMEGNN